MTSIVCRSFLSAAACLVALAMPSAAQPVTYTGMWNNTTFGSSGAMEIVLDQVTPTTFALTVDLDGFVFGAADPDPFTITGDGTSAGPINATLNDDPFFGDLALALDTAGKFTIGMSNLPNPGIESVDITGTISPTTIMGDYAVFFTTAEVVSTTGDAGRAADAVGTFSLQVPEPGMLGGLVMLSWLGRPGRRN